MQLLVAILAVVIGLAFAFGGWRFFLLLLPLWGFIVGFSLGTEAMRSLFGDGTFATLLSWIVGFVIAVVFAILSYLYYYAAIAILAGTVGYAIGASAWGIIGSEQGVIAFVIGLVVGVVFAIAVRSAIGTGPHQPASFRRLPKVPYDRRTCTACAWLVIESMLPR